MTGTTTAEQPTKRRGTLAGLYTGTGAFEIVGQRKRWYIVTAVIVLLALLSMLVRGFTWGIDFEGGTRIQMPAVADVSTADVETVFSDTLGFEPEAVQTVGAGSGATFQIRSEALDQGQVAAVQSALFEEFQPAGSDGQPSINSISVADVSETWGSQITEKALIALVVFLVIVSVYIAVRYERDMAIAAIAALFFDIIVTAGVYSLVGFEVTPATVIGLLTILGFSLYDTVVVFDKVEENTRGILHLHRRTYGEQANLAVNQTLMRSINTTVISVLPVIALMVVAVWLLGVGTLKDLALVQLVGIVVGAFSSIFFATPLLVTLKEWRGPIAKHTRKVLAKREEAAARVASAGSGQVPQTAPAPAATVVDPSAARYTPVQRAPRPGARPTGKRAKRKS
ncbi:protein translocase subunit SecF [Rhodococcus coprophilus]|uniref:Protein-export membrane protein SecF n=1 Tax=Rhodococcus coprophilus TaxID=38310 RepID=A0A2X4TQ23_9NOCA|nr:protein translocase subunit SecF [Rhodococcus coprophilus]MBM7461181.1 preprotein translocase subunit SecF [Rhodococcus coprophilus]SQI29003.1 preprotein translocase subunit SecF [Rhodococcus coprophilus]